MSGRYQLSETLLERPLRTIPLGSQTFSKSKTQLPYGVSPYFVARAKGSRLWDVDGNNEYIDFVNGLACVTLGYCDPDVDGAVRRQIANGVTPLIGSAVSERTLRNRLHPEPLAPLFKVC